MAILKKAGELTDAGAIVFGLPASGKSTYLIDLLKGKKNVLWLYTNNAHALVGNKNVNDWMIGRIDTLEDLEGVLAQLNDKSVKADYIVLDGLEGLRDFALVTAQAESSKPEVTKQSDWGDAGRIMDNKLRELRNHCVTLYGAVNVVPVEDDAGNVRGHKLDVNPDVRNRLVRLFGDKVHTYTKPIKKDGDIKGLEYLTAHGEFATRLANL